MKTGNDKNPEIQRKHIQLHACRSRATVVQVLQVKISELLLNYTNVSFRYITVLQANPDNPEAGSSWSGYKSARTGQIRHFHYPRVRVLLRIADKFLLHTAGYSGGPAFWQKPSFI